GAATKPEGDTLLAEDRKAAHAFWVQTVMKITNPEELADTIRYCKAKRVKTKSPEGEDMVKVQFLLAGELPEAIGLLKAIRATLRAEGGIKTIGGAPRGVLVREAQRLLDVVK
ncbi:unnamed protein product, partial [Prorocentrum cordatum]